MNITKNMKKNGYVEKWVLAVLAFIIVFIGFITFVCVLKFKKESKMTIQDVVKLNVSESKVNWVVTGLLNNGHVALLMQDQPHFTKPQNVAYQYHGILAINNIDAHVNDVVKITEYSSPHKNCWYEVTSLVK